MMDDFSKYMNEMMKPFQEIQKITEPLRAFQESIQNTQRQIQESFEQFDKVFSSLSETTTQIHNLSESFKEVGERLSKYYKDTPSHLLLIAEHGWFIELDTELNLPLKLVSDIENGQPEEINDYLIKYYSSNLKRIISVLNKRHPTRHEIFDEIHNSYNEKKYFVTIPCILSQVDGICFDYTKKKFFIRNHRLPQVLPELEKMSNSFLDLFLSPLKNQTPIMTIEENVKNFPSKLNRHEIIHGVNTTYGTELNSLKCISLLKYISDLLIDTNEKH